ncbi:MAG: CBS domain-containing protein [Acidobacteriota bacterium]
MPERRTVSIPDLEIPSAREWMSPVAAVVRPDDPVFEAIGKLLRTKSSALPVVDDDHQLVGLLTEKDCLRVLSNLAWERTADGGTVGEYQSPVPHALEPSMDVFRVTRMFLERNFPMLPVVEDGRPIGQITRLRLLECVDHFRNEVRRKSSKFEAEAGSQTTRPRSIEALQRLMAESNPEQVVRVMGRKTSGDEG